MIEIILKDNIEEKKIDALIQFLRSMNIDVELKKDKKKIVRKKEDFSLSAGIWEDYKINGVELRKQAWNRK